MITPALRHSGTLSFAIKLTVASTLLTFASLSAHAEEQPVSPPQPPDILLGPLFNDVQSAKLFPDQKTFADAVPNSDPLMILADYRMQRNQSGFDLRHFVDVNFTLPKEGEKIRSAGRTVAA
ncbi:trehalase [Citrobacter koseri]|uniref:Trehalase n=1 Tax=Citrobacter koseri TaxID=545 RepID=A0A3S4ISI5_CITKO|nr:trehalase [Citrobacter koseri]